MKTNFKKNNYALKSCYPVLKSCYPDYILSCNPAIMYKTIKAKIHNKQLILEDDMEIPENSEVLIVFMNDADEVEENLNDYEFVFDEPVKADYLLKISNRDVLK